MRSIGVKLFLGLFLGSCSKEEMTIVTFPEDYPSKWQLMSVVIGLSGSIVSGDQLPYFEEYIFNEDNTFSKTRTLEDTTIVVSGSFSIIDTYEKITLSLQYDEESPIIDNCIKDLREVLLVTSDQSFSNNVLACDRGSMGYSRVD